MVAVLGYEYSRATVGLKGRAGRRNLRASPKINKNPRFSTKKTSLTSKPLICENQTQAWMACQPSETDLGRSDRPLAIATIQSRK